MTYAREAFRVPLDPRIANLATVKSRLVARNDVGERAVWVHRTPGKLSWLPLRADLLSQVTWARDAVWDLWTPRRAVLAAVKGRLVLVRWCTSSRK